MREEIGVSTHFMPNQGEGLEKSLDLVQEAGFQILEIVPADFQGNIGYPQTKISIGLSLDELTPEKISRLTEKVSVFSYITIHGSQQDLNIASHNPGIRRESQRQYLKCVELAKELGAKLATFHPGTCNPQAIIGDEEFVKKCNIEFGLKVCDALEKHDLISGYENLGGMNFQMLEEIIEGINNPRFGLVLDVGHCFLVPDADHFRIVENLHHRIVEIHLHGTYHRPDRGFETHQPLDLDDCTDLPNFFKLLGKKGFTGPIILEILAPSIKQYLEFSQQAKRLINGWCKEG